MGAVKVRVNKMTIGWRKRRRTRMNASGTYIHMNECHGPSGRDSRTKVHNLEDSRCNLQNGYWFGVAQGSEFGSVWGYDEGKRPKRVKKKMLMVMVRKRKEDDRTIGGQRYRRRVCLVANTSGISAHSSWRQTSIISCLGWGTIHEHNTQRPEPQDPEDPRTRAALFCDERREEGRRAGVCRVTRGLVARVVGVGGQNDDGVHCECGGESTLLFVLFISPCTC